MFDRSVRRHPVQTFQFWFVVLTCFVAVSAWKLDLLSLPRTKLPLVLDEPMPPPPQSELNEPGESAISDLSAVAPQQTEIDSPSNPEALPPVDRELASTVPQEPQTLQSETTTPEIRTVSASITQTAGMVVHADAEAQTSVPSVISPLAPVESLDLTEADRLIAAEEDVAALRLLSGLYWKHSECRAQLMDRLNLLARKVYFSPSPHYIAPYTVEFGDRMETVARKFHLTREYLAKLNRLDAGALRAGQSIKVLQGPFSAVVDVSDMEMTIHSQGYYMTRFKVGFGTDSSIPEGRFQITDKVLNPDYYGPEGVISHTDPLNPLGSRWLTINDEQHSLPAYGIHGTTDSSLIEQVQGPGCLRLQQREAEMVYDLLTIGSELIIHP